MRKHGNPVAKKRHKYNAVKTVVDGITFASKAEARRYAELKLLERAGEISELDIQHEFKLYAKDILLGKYIADFSYIRHDNDRYRCVHEDVKGMKTPLYRWKKRHVEAQYGIKIVEIK